MKKIIILVLVVVMLAATGVVFAQETKQEEKVENVSGFIDIRNDFIYPKDGVSQTGQSLNALWQYKWFGGYLETDYKSQSHTLTIKPSLFVNKGPLYFVGGAATDNNGSDFVQAGIWYIDDLGKFKILFDSRNYFSTSGQSNGYIDNFLQVMYPITEKISVGTELCFDHWWNDGHNWYLVGPKISYQLTKNVSVYIRGSYEWNVLETGTETVVQVRTGVMINF